MLNHLRSDTRIFLVNIRSMAMQDGLEVVIKNIQKYLMEHVNIPVVDRAAIDLLQAELYYLNAQSSDSINIFETEIMPVLKNLPDEVQITILHNKNTVSFGALTSNATLDFYYLYDYRKLSGFDPWYNSKLLTAYNAVEEGKHFDALPIYWQHLLYTFNQGIWNAHSNAYAMISKEFITLNWLPKSAYYAIMSQNSKLADIICERLIYSRDVNFIEQTLDIVLKKSQLLRHASVACKIIEGIQDEIPDAYLDITIDYLLGICSNKRQNPFEINPIVNSWKAIKSLAHKLSSRKASELLDIITTNEWFTSVNVIRRHLIEIIDNLIDVLPKYKFMKLSKIIIPFAKEKKSDIDYVQVVNLLCHIAYRDKNKAKKFLAKQLYSKGTKIDSYLGQVVNNFDAKIKYDDLEGTVKIVSQNILLQVQRLKPEEKPQIVFDTYGNIEKVDKDKKEKIIVQMSANSHLRTLTVNKHLLKPSHINMLVNSFVRMIENPYNSLSNKMILVNAIIELANKFTKIQKQKIFKLLKPLAEGNIIESSVAMSHQEASNPLNPFKMSDTKPEVISGGALYALSCLENSHPGIYGNKVNKLIEKAVVDKNPIIRKHGYWAATKISKPKNRLLYSVLYGTRDSDYQATIAAFDVILNRKDFDLTLENWHLLFISLYEAAHSEHKELRRISAIISNKLFKKAPLEYKGKIKELTEKLKSDICHSVRVLPKNP